MAAFWRQAVNVNRGSSVVHPVTQSVVLFDGVCGLCNGFVQFLLRHDHRGAFKFAALQSNFGRSVVQGITGTAALPSSLYVIADFGSDAPRVYAQSDAVLFVARQLGWPWRAASVFRILPRRLRDGLYAALARTRYRWFGQYEQCMVPKPEHRKRFFN